MHVRRLSAAVAIAALAAVPAGTAASATQTYRAAAAPAVKYAVPAVKYADVPTVKYDVATVKYDAAAVKYAPSVKYADVASIIRYGFGYLTVPGVKYAQPLPAAQAARRLSVTVAARPSVVKPMQRMHLTGVVGPRAAGAKVTVQVKARTWQTIPGAATKADRLGRYAIDVWGKRRGTFTLRVVGALGGSWGTSKLITLKVR